MQPVLSHVQPWAPIFPVLLPVHRDAGVIIMGLPPRWAEAMSKTNLSSLIIVTVMRELVTKNVLELFLRVGGFVGEPSALKWESFMGHKELHMH